jgi:hypothetical protein
MIYVCQLPPPACKIPYLEISTGAIATLLLWGLTSLVVLVVINSKMAYNMTELIFWCTRQPKNGELNLNHT